MYRSINKIVSITKLENHCNNHYVGQGWGPGWDGGGGVYPEVELAIEYDLNDLITLIYNVELDSGEISVTKDIIIEDPTAATIMRIGSYPQLLWVRT